MVRCRAWPLPSFSAVCSARSASCSQHREQFDRLAEIAGRGGFSPLTDAVSAGVLVILARIDFPFLVGASYLSDWPVVRPFGSRLDHPREERGVSGLAWPP